MDGCARSALILALAASGCSRTWLEDPRDAATADAAPLAREAVGGAVTASAVGQPPVHRPPASARRLSGFLFGNASAIAVE